MTTGDGFMRDWTGAVEIWRLMRLTPRSFDLTKYLVGSTRIEIGRSLPSANFNWNVADRYFPSVGEVLTSLTIVTIGVLVFRWIVNRMPVVHEHPDWRGAH